LYRRSQEAVRLRDEFLSIASHELRTPLAAIKTTAQSALRAQGRGLLDDTRVSRSFNTIARATDHVARLASDLLDVARLRTGNMPLERQPIDCAALLERAIAAFRDQWESQRTVEVHNAASGVQILGDADRIEQVLANLLDNAAKYSPGGEPISVAAVRDGEGVRVSVSDRGIGLPEDAGERLFQPFGRASNAVSQHIPGLGLGLYICRQIIESHGGRIWLESAGEGAGSSFHVWLPAAPAA
jgi:two-component system, OmpR family, sensor kinase